MTDDEWIEKAMADETIVANLLLRLRHADPQPLPKIAQPLQLDWTVRQRRSKPVLKHAENSKKNEGDAARASPTTPLCFSGATSISGGGGGVVDGVEESSRLANPLDDARSKVAVTSETTTTTTTINKRLRKKKTLAELREEESWLLTERRYLSTELATLRLTVEKHRSTNESLKRMKLDSQSCQTMKTVITRVVTEEGTCNQLCQMEAANASTSTNNLSSVQQTLPTSTIQDFGSEEAHCLLPDLNLPIDDADSEIPYGMS